MLIIDSSFRQFLYLNLEDDACANGLNDFESVILYLFEDIIR